MTDIKFEAGKSYRNRGGDKVKILHMNNTAIQTENCMVWPNGKRYLGDYEDKFDIIAEWQEPEVMRVIVECNEFTIGDQPAMKSPASPIETRTTRTIKSGTYGRLCVRYSEDQKNCLNICLSDGFGFSISPKNWSLNDLDEAIHTLSQIREVIAENENK